MNATRSRDRKTSPKVLAKRLWKQAYQAEANAQKLRAMGFERYADSVNAAAVQFSDAAVALEKSGAQSQ